MSTVSTRAADSTRLARLTPPGNLLDVGCAAGFFVYEAGRAASWNARGTDVSVPMVDWGRSRLDTDIALGSFDQTLPPTTV